MTNYSILLVDDEEELRAGIRNKIDWKALGFSLVAEAANGQDALEIAEQYCPDVVLTDIKMPFMDGLELCRRLKQQLPAVRLVIFSGFDEFAYAKQAIGMNVFEYLLKPLNATELSEVLQRLHQEMDEQREKMQDMQALRSRYEESLPVLKGEFYARLLRGKMPAEQVLPRAARYEIDFCGNYWAVVRIHAGSFENKYDEYLLLSVQDFFQQHFAMEGSQTHWLFYEDDVTLIASCKQPNDIYTLVAELERVRMLGENYLGVQLTIGVGQAVEQLAELSISEKGAETALDYRMVLGMGKTFYIGDLEPRQTAGLTFGELEEKELTNAVKLGNAEDIRAVLTRVLQSSKESSLSRFQCYFLETITCLMKIARQGDIPLENVFGEGFTGAVQLTDFASPVALAHWVEDCCIRLQEQLQTQRSYATSCTVDKACDFIRQNYSDPDLSVDTLCEELHLSPAYFSTLFKRETGLSFTAYVTQVRMEEAAHQLKTTQEKTYIIAQQCGYIDANYFSYVFKRYYGTSPSKYRAAAQ